MKYKFKLHFIILLFITASPVNTFATLIKENFTQYLVNPGASSYSFSHTQNAGADGHLVVIIACPSSVIAVTYNGFTMTQVFQNFTSYSNYWSVWELDAPSVGANPISVTLSAPVWQNISTVCYSFTGCSGVGNTSINNSQMVDQTTNLNISENSMIIGSVIAGIQTAAYIQIPQGTARAIDWQHAINQYTFGGISPCLTAGSTTIKGGASGSQNIIMAVEVKEASSLPARRVFIVD